MKIYCMSDIHACLESFEAALENVICHLDEDDTMLLLLGDYVHAGIDETVGDMWEWETSDDIYTAKYPAETGRIEGLDMKVVAGHVYTSEISGDSTFNDIYYDGENHIYIDGDVLSTGVIPVLMVDTDTDSYYRITDGGCWLLTEYEE